MDCQPARLLCPWDSPGKNTGGGSQALLQGIFLTQRLNLRLSCLLHWQVASLPLVSPGKPGDKLTCIHTLDSDLHQLRELRQSLTLFSSSSPSSSPPHHHRVWCFSIKRQLCCSWYRVWLVDSNGYFTEGKARGRSQVTEAAGGHKEAGGPAFS